MIKRQYSAVLASHLTEMSKRVRQLAYKVLMDDYYHWYVINYGIRHFLDMTSEIATRSRRHEYIRELKYRLGDHQVVVLAPTICYRIVADECNRMKQC